jgi:hypothetical protein
MSEGLPIIFSKRWLLCIALIGGVGDSADLILPIWTWEWNSSWKRPEPCTKLWS